MNDLPECFGYYPNATPPNTCDSCRVVNVCRQVLPREEVRKLLKQLLNVIREGVPSGEGEDPKEDYGRNRAF